MPGPSKDRIAFSRLVDWVEGRLPEEEARAVEEQMALADSATLADVAWLRKFVRATEDSVLESPPPEVRSTLIARFKAHTEDRRPPGLLKRIVATLTFDDGLHPAVGVRSVGAQGTRRQLVYSADALDVALNLLPRARDKKFDLDGQVFSDDDAQLGSFSVQLLEGETERAITATDEVGGFAIEAIPPGVYEIILSSERAEVSIKPVELNV
ncbi:MAG: carboxypeptidase-like regulatory domain-containing protein [Actinomycetota bacterium]|nr:carboxypeptidase-like regulatory domain-containing protein [Actinomycetota bacterium]